MALRILLLTGMTPDDRIYDRLLPRLPNASIVPWITPQFNEPISRYCDRLAATIDCDEPNMICGVSFAGIIARELAPKINARTCVLISSARDPRELHRGFGAFGRSLDAQPDIVIDGGGHVLPLTHGRSIARVLGELATQDCPN